MNEVLVMLGIALLAGLVTAAAMLLARRGSKILTFILALILPPLFAWQVMGLSFDYLLPVLVAEPGQPSADDGPLIFAGAMMLAGQAGLAAFSGALLGALMTSRTIRALLKGDQ